MARVATTRFIRTIPLALAALLPVPALAADRAPQPATSAAWLEQATRAIAAEEYHFQLREGTWSAPNRVLGLRTRVDETGFEVEPRSPGQTPFRFRATLAEIGRDTMLPIGRGVVRADGHRITIDRDGVEEWLINAAEGIEHGFTLYRRPEGQGELWLDLALEGLQAVSEGDEAIALRDSAGRWQLRYSTPFVRDASGAEIPARLAVKSGTIAIVIGDAEARYPLTVDPLITPAAWQVAGGSSTGNLGAAVATAGDVNGDGYSDAILGMPGYDGAGEDSGLARLYLGSSTGLRTTPAWTTLGAYHHRYGGSLAAAGDVNGDGFDDVIVGGTEVRLFMGSATGLSTSPAWTLWSGTDCNFPLTVCTHHDVSGAGDVDADGYDDLVIGDLGYAVGSFPNYDYYGQFLVYHGRSSGVPTLGAAVRGTVLDGEFGSPVAALGDVDADGYDDIAVGATANGTGMVAIYYGSASGIGARYLEDHSTVSGVQKYGWSIAGIGDWNGDGYADMAVGAPYADNGGTDTGFVELHLGSSSGFDGTPDRIITGGGTGTQFGYSVATAGDVNGDGRADFSVGGPAFNVSGVGRAGRYYLYQGVSGPIPPNPLDPTLTIDGAAIGDDFGKATATAGDVDGDGFGDVLIGAPGIDVTLTDEGRVFLHRGSPDGLAATSGWAYSVSGQSATNLGFSLAPAGDVNGDGFSDLIAGAPRYDNGGTDAGCAFVFLGSSAGLPAAPSWQACATQGAGLFGQAVSGVGDVNDDGYDDIAIGAPNFDDGLSNNGKVFVWFGSSAGLGPNGDTTNADFAVQGAVAGIGLGQALGWTDANGDGYADLLIGGNGQAWLHYGSGSGPAATAGWTATGGSSFGRSLAGAGDTDRDGYGDVIVGERLYTNGQTEEGAAHVFFGSKDGLSAGGRIWQGNQAGANFGTVVGSAGDVNGDGYSDVFMGAPLWDVSTNGNEGRVFVYHGAPAGPGAVANWAASGDFAGVQLGFAVSAAGDVNGDGYSDLAASTPFYSFFGTERGATYVYLGGGSGLASAPAWSLYGDGAGSHSGSELAGGLDVNGDGFGDLVIAQNLVPDGVGNGRLDAFYGGGGASADRHVRQMSGSFPISSPVALGGMASFADTFDVSVRARSAGGRARVRLEAEVRRLDAPFSLGSATLVTTPWFRTNSLGTGGWHTDRTVTLDGLERRSYRWRVRVKAHNPWFPVTPWFTPAGNGRTEADLRMLGAVVPGKVAGVTVTRQSAQCQIAWNYRVDADSYDVVRGVLSLLRSSGGNFSSATTACLANDVTSTSVTDGAVAAAGDGIWWLVRATNVLATGSYDDVSGGTPRDAEIGASGVACP